MYIKRYVVTTFDGSMILICADRHRRCGDVHLFEARTFDPGAGIAHRWRTVSALRHAHVVRVQQFTAGMSESDPRPDGR